MHSETFPGPQIKFARRGTALLSSVMTRLSAWYWSARTRRQLAELDAHGLRDIGLSEADRRRECARPFWHGLS